MSPDTDSEVLYKIGISEGRFHLKTEKFHIFHGRIWSGTAKSQEARFWVAFFAVVFFFVVALRADLGFVLGVAFFFVLAVTLVVAAFFFRPRSSSASSQVLGGQMPASCSCFK